MGNREQNKEEYTSMANNNAILLSFEGWIKYIEGFTKGLDTAKSVDASAVMICIGEMLEYMNGLRTKLVLLLTHCEKILEKNECLELENNKLKEEIKKLNTLKLEDKNGKDL